MSRAAPDHVSRLHILSVERRASEADDVLAFTVDTPRPEEKLPCGGIEINGWVIGRSGPVARIHWRTHAGDGGAAPLSVARPDVAADYPGSMHALESGFSFWIPLPGPGVAGPWHVFLEAETDAGRHVPLAAIRGQVRNEPRNVPFGYRAVEAPDFVIIGAQRGGTTSLHAYLGAHPSIITPATKELHFLTDRHERGRDWYLGQFPAALPDGAITGEATPYALFHPRSPQRLRTVAPSARLIVLLRDPVERAYSHYLLERSRGLETLSFADALDAEAARLAGEEARLAADESYVSFAHKHASYAARGNYERQLARWFSVFPREQLLILRSEDLYERTQQTFSRVTDFLELPPASHVPFAVHNQTTGPRLDPVDRERLSRHFAPLNARLADLLGWDPGWA